MGALTPINRDAKGPEDDEKAEAVYSILHTMYPVPITSTSGYYHDSCGMSRHIVHVLVENGYGVVIMCNT